MELSKKISLCLFVGEVLVLGLLAAEVFSRKETTVTEKTKEVATNVTTSHKETVTTKRPDGKEITKIIEDNKVEANRTSTDSSTAKVLEPTKKTVHLQALLGVKSYSDPQPIYGLHVSKEVIGPITIGLWGFTDGRVGVSLGVNF